jgi:nicotinate phosphoribosyltransferase
MLTGIVDDDTLAWLADYRFSGDIDGYPEGELYFPGSPILTVRGTFADAVLLETLTLSVLNHDSAIASAAARMVTAANGRPIIEMGSRRTHEAAAVAAARAAYLAGFASTSNLEADRRFDIPTAGTAAHAFVLLHDDELSAFTSQVKALGPETTLLVDTYDIRRGVERAIEAAGTGLGAIRIDSGDLGELARQAREQLDVLGATNTKIILSGDLDEYAIAALRAEPVDAYGVGTALVTGSGAPTAGMVYKLVEVDGRPVAKRSASKESRGGRKSAVRRYKPTGTAIEEVVHPVTTEVPLGPHDRVVPIPLVRGGQQVPGLPTLEQSREHLRAALVSVPWEGLKLSRGEPALPTVFEGI